ncbi:hypothetical protein Asp14428_50360 [Actinoplanes sp. NBRC 14428]|uniref:hypothetical protein n=1 Tax=Pseudosporangium ferrugineum TaxID=439699 RepID=UPI000D052CB5|nr:hypothetical protein [Pseudosporangium ferrugineum]BCJ53561.1 hypothetical protein Asp14428_50360 [Actinoplanes sp. NBRC 14428]
MFAASIVAAIAVAGLNVASASPASAAAGSWTDYGNRNPITSSSATWKCNGTVAITSGVGAQVCAIRSSGGGATQAAIIVRNNLSGAYWIGGHVELWDWANTQRISAWDCAGHDVRSNTWSVCFGKTLTFGAYVNAKGNAGGKNLGLTGRV